MAANLRLLYGRWLVQQSLFDEASEQLAGLNPGDVVAPAELLFYQGVVYYRLLNQEQGLKAIDDLLDGAEASPRRYVAVARLMQDDLGQLRPDTPGPHRPAHGKHRPATGSWPRRAQGPQGAKTA